MINISREQVAQTGSLPDGTQLLQDTIPLKVIDRKILTESVKGKSPIMLLTGVFQRADEKNANGRVYPLDVLSEAIGDMQDAVKERRVLGEFDHPSDAKIHMERVSHLITKLWLENKTVYGQIEVINDNRCPCGSMLSCYIDRGIQIGISSRGVGDMEVSMNEGEESYTVQPGFKFITFDTVAEPSVKGTQLKKLEESINHKKMNTRELIRMREALLQREIRRFLG